MTNDRLYAVLTYFGTLPFAACAMLLTAGVPGIAGIGSWAEIAAGYGLAIASFMAGTHWGTYLQHAPGAPLNLLLTSNAITVAVWLTFALAPTAVSLTVTGCAFLLLLAVDYRLASAGMITSAYLVLRRNATLVVVAMLTLTVVLS